MVPFERTEWSTKVVVVRPTARDVSKVAICGGGNVTTAKPERRSILLNQSETSFVERKLDELICGIVITIIAADSVDRSSRAEGSKV